jgi:tripartite-type tricarboxylate transporter receptor subunit TctC
MTMTLNRRLFIAGAAGSGLATLGWTPLAQAQALDSAKVLCGYPAGGTTDAVSRRIAEKLQSGGYAKVALVDNKAGASGRIAIEELKRSPTDGSVMLLTPASAISLFPHVYTKLTYGMEDVTPVSTACRIAFGFGVGPAVPASVKTLRDFLAWAKANPAQANYASPGAGSPPHFIGALLGKEAGVDLRHVPYRGSAPGVQDLLGGQVSSMTSPIGDYLAYLKEGKLRLLATSGATRSRFAPDVPTYAEQGFKSLVVNEYYQVFLPGKASPEVTRRAADAVRAAVMSPDVVEAFAKLGLESAASTPAELAQMIKTENAQWGPVVKAVGFTPEN